jgi:hypothetical protein
MDRYGVGFVRLYSTVRKYNKKLKTKAAATRRLETVAFGFRWEKVADKN